MDIGTRRNRPGFKNRRNKRHPTRFRLCGSGGGGVINYKQEAGFKLFRFLFILTPAENFQEGDVENLIASI